MSPLLYRGTSFPMQVFFLMLLQLALTHLPFLLSTLPQECRESLLEFDCVCVWNFCMDANKSGISPESVVYIIFFLCVTALYLKSFCDLVFEVTLSSK